MQRCFDCFSHFLPFAGSGLWNVSVLLDSEEFLETKTVENSGWVCVDLIMPGVGMISLESQR